MHTELVLLRRLLCALQTHLRDTFVAARRRQGKKFARVRVRRDFLALFIAQVMWGSPARSPYAKPLAAAIEQDIA